MKCHGRRAMLNGPGYGATAAIVAEVQDTAEWMPGHDSDGEKLKKISDWSGVPHVEFAISDCSRSIGFETWWFSAEDRVATLSKIDQMILTLQEFREGIVIEQERFVERKAIVDSQKQD